ncbi:MAG: YceI family protein [Lutibacter sp.]|jgi:polyisoprenoid-binding protein YceI
MKKIYVLPLLLLTMILYTSCKESVKKEPAIVEKTYSVDAKATKINWTAYKTTAKAPVKGQFTEVTIENAKKASTPLEALNGLKFDIPVSSLFTNDTIRDGKLKKFFFGAMKNTSLLSGTVNTINETSGSVSLKMNGITKDLPVTFVVKDNIVTIEANMELNDWQAEVALNTLHEVCKELHTGKDGISKTWSDVKIEVITDLKYE